VPTLPGWQTPGHSGIDQHRQIAREHSVSESQRLRCSVDGRAGPFFFAGGGAKVIHRLFSVFEKRFFSFLSVGASAGSHGWQGFQRTLFGLLWQTPG
jgi:hypothetical protein